MRNILTIFRKEWDRVIKDKRLVFSVMLLPGLMIFILYSFIGGAIQTRVLNLETRLALINEPAGFVTLVDTLTGDDGWEYQSDDAESISTYKLHIDSGNWELLIIFPNDFDEAVNAKEIPEIEIYYNPNEPASSQLYSQYLRYLSTYHQQLSLAVYGDTQAFSLTVDSLPIDETKQTGMMVSMLLPMLVLMFLFAGAMGIGPEAIAGEKERGTIATLLITPVKRSEIAMGKVLGLSVLSLISACSSFLGILVSLPKLFAGEDIDMSIYSFTDYLQILLLLFSTVFVIVGIISIVSAYAKNMKEAGTLILPFYLLTILIGVTSMFGQQAAANPWLYIIPLYNSVQTLIAIFTFDPSSWLYTVITILSNIAYLVLFVFILNRMFKSEKIMFSK